MRRTILLAIMAFTLAGCGAVPLDPYPNGFAHTAGADNPALQDWNCTSALNCFGQGDF